MWLIEFTTTNPIFNSSKGKVTVQCKKKFQCNFYAVQGKLTQKIVSQHKVQTRIS